MNYRFIWALLRLGVLCFTPILQAKGTGDELALTYFGTDHCSAESVRVSAFSTRPARFAFGELASGDWAILIEGGRAGQVTEVIQLSGDRFPDDRIGDLNGGLDFSSGQLSFWDWGHRTLIGLDPVSIDRKVLLFVPSDTGCLEEFLEMEFGIRPEIVFVNAVVRQGVRNQGSSESPLSEVLERIQWRRAVITPPEASPADGSDSTRAPFVCIAGGPGALSCSFSAGSVGPFDSMNCSIQCVPPRYACCGLGFLSNCACIDGDDGGIPPSLPPPPDDDAGDGGGSGGGGSEGDSGGGGGDGGVGLPPAPGDDGEDDDPPGDDSSNSVGDGRDG